MVRAGLRRIPGVVFASSLRGAHDDSPTDSVTPTTETHFFPVAEARCPAARCPQFRLLGAFPFAFPPGKLGVSLPVRASTPRPHPLNRSYLPRGFLPEPRWSSASDRRLWSRHGSGQASSDPLHGLGVPSALSSRQRQLYVMRLKPQLGSHTQKGALRAGPEYSTHCRQHLNWKLEPLSSTCLPCKSQALSQPDRKASCTWS